MYNSREDTLNHIKEVDKYISLLIRGLGYRKSCHDFSKLEEPEKSIFDEYTPKLKECTYGSKEYQNHLKNMNVALNHHYSNNRHHPEHFQNGIKSMNLVDICEMMADWKAATLRHANGDILKSIDINQTRFGYSDELKQILINTVKFYFE